MAQCNHSEWTVYLNITAKSAQSMNWTIWIYYCQLHHAYFVPGSEDYIYFSDEYVLTNTSQQAVAVISIVNDNHLEIDEKFRAEISLVLMEDRNCVLLLPNAADVTILDNDSELLLPITLAHASRCNHHKCSIPVVVVIGFVQDNYSFTEGDGLVNLTLEMAPDSGQLGREVKISLHILPVSALSKL